MMANHYRSTIADVIQQFDNNRLPLSTYEAVAWVGLGKLDKNVTTIAWDNLPPDVKASTNAQLNFHNKHQRNRLQNLLETVFLCLKITKCGYCELIRNTYFYKPLTNNHFMKTNKQTN
ncbi:hypothetical protein SAMN05444143_105138 [Flavobacterium succinicans]|uniref:Uncharacterized protein n=2 Tax=Flavobacterium succinicans TaxID=29536 RepID=A0A1I4VRX2_9FLAO|nr:hypothetical protein [Flavobacterium succinicans]SFN03885.1 hypothetical protein SAMN05444143_105138 [Flavobacterium succinicans]